MLRKVLEMQRINIHTNKGSRQKDAIEFALYCIANRIDMLKLSTSELMKLKAEWNESNFNQNQWRPTAKDIEEAEKREKKGEK